MPDKKQLKETIAQGDDSIDYVLILNTDGTFELIEGAGAGAVSHLNYVTRWNPFDQGNDYVGSKAAKDKEHISRIMDGAKKAWDKFKETGYTRITNLWEYPPLFHATTSTQIMNRSLTARCRKRPILVSSTCTRPHYCWADLIHKKPVLDFSITNSDET
ncbi:hypothetical protein DFQ01_110120 [Paenibacillus cellulosilyticus]|uniref:Uncharacterized protein n=1 Tax=Paenibacillus cellulosilyticus TaxID=375489 RepID=A0A2V2YV41_9BACL|nr:hypothetical protein [Paenibacillus cellulosilyticus]PWW01230.1 hypothetical protein DFQ01_110120 [Paenibacillus cellulosilyticus]QKS46815.1 hypothetical protein HUB94_20240 [Paenibacillus cellulosilyticus]